MKNEEVNKVIAEYMGYDYINYDDLPEIQHISGSSIQDIEGGMLYRGNHFTLSLDALVPVWERLKEDGVWINKMGNRNYNHFGFFSEKDISEYNPFDPFDFYESLHTDTIQEAAAHAAAKAILKLKGNK